MNIQKEIDKWIKRWEKAHSWTTDKEIQSSPVAKFKMEGIVMALQMVAGQRDSINPYPEITSTKDFHKGLKGE